MATYRPLFTYIYALYLLSRASMDRSLYYETICEVSEENAPKIFALIQIKIINFDGGLLSSS